MVSVSIEEIVRELALPIFAGGRAVVDVEVITPDENKAITQCVSDCVAMLEKVSPKLATTMRDHLPFFMKAGAIAKAHFPTVKPIRYPSEPGTIGVNVLIPQAIKYVVTPSATDPCYTSYSTNLWEMPLTAGTAAYILGDGTNYYKAHPHTDQHTLLALPKDCVIEIGSTPKFDQMRIWTEIQAKYSPWTVYPLVEQPIEEGKTIYQYNTLAAQIITHDLGVMWGLMPKYAGTAILKLLGLYFYEHDFHPTLKWVS